MYFSIVFLWSHGPSGLARALALCALLAGVSVASAQGQPSLQGTGHAGERLLEVYEGRVSRVSDGDTLWVKPLAGGRYRKLRLDGLDAPEICQPGGVAARDALAQRVLGQVVTVRVRGFDDYGRAVARLEQGSFEVGAWLVQEGHAWSSRWRGRPTAYADEGALARIQRRGVFQSPDAEEPRAFRRRHGPCPNPSVVGGGAGGLKN
ncbi:MAG: thermonuclease family protein [Hydrogenophaga sp.]|nr:thermonuclease family protein [Hydrogenophaga sp.]